MLSLRATHAAPFRLIMSALLLEISSSALVEPTPAFLEVFASEFQKDGFLFDLPDEKSKKSFLISQIKHFR